MADSGSRNQFRFKTGRGARRSDALLVDEAIDLVGFSLFPDSWGVEPEFDGLPLFWRPGKAMLSRPLPKGAGFETVDVERTLGRDTQAEQFRAAYRTLQQGLRRRIHSKAVPYDALPSSLPGEVFTRQCRRIFGLGTVRWKGKKCWVWIDRPDFEDWLNTHVQRSVKLESKCQDLLAEFLVHKIASGVLRRISKPQISALISAVFKVKATNGDLDAIMVNLPASARKGGRPPKNREWKEVLSVLASELRKQLPAAPALRHISKEERPS